MEKDEIDVCQTRCIHPEKIVRTREAMCSARDLNGLAEIFKVLGDATRVSILQALSIEELCVCDLAMLLNLTQSAVSHQLRLLRAAHLVKFRKEGKIVYYSLDDAHVKTLFAQGLEHVQKG
ncbi:MAG: metalloregulator ArsR/SmtB family transcription factor [Pseudomonadota bacterium]